MTPEPPRIEAEAARWAVRLQSGALAPEERRELDAWLEGDVRHRGAWVRAQAAWLNLDRLGALAARGMGLGREVLPMEASASRSDRRWFLAAGLSSLALAGTAAWWAWRRRGEVYVSDVGEVRRVTLPDGSSMLLNTASRAAVHFGSELREVTLLDGEGLFEVEKNPRRPFMVRAGSVSVRAVGTAFSVRVLNQRVNVTVTEGVVEVADSSASASVQPYKISANQEALITKAQGVRVRAVAPAEAERHLAWREGMLAFGGESLSQAVEEINRHNRRQITIDDPALAKRPVVGIFRASDTEGFAQTVATALGGESVTEGDVIHLRPNATR
jgi:transmembrane sensor